MKWQRTAAVVLLFGSAGLVRGFGLTEGHMQYHPTKQYRSALTARAYYYHSQPTVAEWQVEVADDALRRIGVIVPTPQERALAQLYVWSGEERVWYGQLLSVVAWLLGGGFVMLAALRISSFYGAFLGTSFYLLAPFGVVSSRSFQPDPLMIGALAASVWLSLRYHERPGRVRYLLAAGSAALAVFIKPIAVFVAVPAFIGAGLGLSESRRRLRLAEVAGFLGIALLPSFGFYLYRILVESYSEWQRESSFVPSYLREFRFWDGWQKRIRLALGFTYFVGGLVGLSLARDRLARALLLSLWIGYVVMCFVVSYKISTHDYYHLPLLLIVSLSIPLLADLVVTRLRDAEPLWKGMGVASLGLGLFLAAGSSIQLERRRPDTSETIERARQIGQLVEHSTATVILEPFYGRPLMYHGEISGEPWPYLYDIRDEALWNPDVPTARARLEGIRAREKVDFFIVWDLEEFERQPDLQRELERFPRMVDNESYVVFDLRAASKP